MNNIAFIINPIAGTCKKHYIAKVIRDSLDKTLFTPTVVFTEYAGHATQLADQFAKADYYAVVAVGGDGTINEVATALRHTNTALGIVPNGSGNGFARHLHIPLRVNRAIEMLNRSEVIQVDYGMVNDRPFFSTCGIGFDALVAYQFAEGGSRGFRSYLQHIIQDLFMYKCDEYHLTGEGVDMTTKAFLITFANAGQWGYDAYIAPKASVQDGLLDTAIMTQFPLIAAPGLALGLFAKHIDNDLYMTTLRTPSIRLERPAAGPMHIDGDPVMMPETLDLSIVKDGLKVLVEKRF